MNVSICISTYGEAVWEEMAERRALPSALAQEPYEIVTEHQPEGNIASARNAAGERAQGGWLCFLDADDELGPGYVAEMHRAWEREILRVKGAWPGSVLLTPAVSYVRKGGQRQRPIFNAEVPLNRANWLVVGTLIQRDLFMEVGGFEDLPHGFEDFSLWSKCWRIGAEVVKVPQAVYIAYINPRSKHRLAWRDRKTQVATHNRVVQELDAWQQAWDASHSIA